MFDGSLPEVAEVAALTDAELVEAAGGWSRAENAACARKLAVMAEIFARRTGLPAGERELWWVDPTAAVSCELSAVLNVSPGMALHQTHRGVALRDRLPRVAELFEQGLISDLLVRTIVWRTYLIGDDDAIATVDAAIAERVQRWGMLSAAKTETAIDALVDEHDPAALRRSVESVAGETVEFGSSGRRRTNRAPPACGRASTLRMPGCSNSLSTWPPTRCATTIPARWISAAPPR